MARRRGSTEESAAPGAEPRLARRRRAAVPIAFHRSVRAPDDLARVAEVLASRRPGGGGPVGAACEGLLESEVGVGRALLTTSCTHALEMAALLLDLEPGDEVILPSFTFSSTANAFVLRGARPVFCDIRPDTCNLDEEQLPALLTERTRAIVPVHYAGVACEMDRITEIAAAGGVAVVEDAAHGLFGTYKGRQLGSLGAMAALSFHETKNFTCGEGGALLLSDPALEERAEAIRDKGTNRAQFVRGQADKYTWKDVGSSYALADVLAAVLLAQFEQRDAVQTRRAEIWNAYADGLRDWAREYGVALPHVPEGCGPAYHLFHVVLGGTGLRSSLMEHLAADGIATGWHYVPLHSSPMGQRLGARPDDCPVAEAVSGGLLRLPLYPELRDVDVERVVERVSAWRPGRPG